MSKLIKFHNRRLIRGQASEWIVRLDRGLKDSERAELQQWLAEDPLHHEALCKQAEVWDQMNLLSGIAEALPLVPEQKRSLLRPMLYGGALATLIGCLVFVSTEPGWNMLAKVTGRSTRVAFEGIYSTTIGEQKTISLPDHSTLKLNTDTRVQVRFTGAGREIELLRGEAGFVVAKDRDKVFTVHVGKNEFKAVGTAFNLRKESLRGIELTVTDGIVRVIVPSVPRPEAWDGKNGAPRPPTEMMVTAGKEALISDISQTVAEVPSEDTEAKLAWQRGEVVFRGQPLEMALEEFNRYTTQHFQLRDASLREIRVAGLFKVGDINGMITALRENFGIQSRTVGDRIELSRAHL